VRQRRTRLHGRFDGGATLCVDFRGDDRMHRFGLLLDDARHFIARSQRAANLGVIGRGRVVRAAAK
jgi:hypothetical protein